MKNPALFERTLDISLIVVVISNGLFAMLAFLLFDDNDPAQRPDHVGAHRRAGAT
jgi:hypothetical protein